MKEFKILKLVGRLVIGEFKDGELVNELVSDEIVIYWGESKGLEGKLQKIFENWLKNARQKARTNRSTP